MALFNGVGNGIFFSDNSAA